MIETFERVDAYDRRVALSAPEGPLRDFNAAGVLASADVHVARRVGVMADEHDQEVLLALAMVVRAVREGSVCLDLADLDAAPEPLAWPDASTWRDRVAASRLVSTGVLHLDHDLLYLDRYWVEEGQVVEDLLERSAQPAPGYDEGRLEAGLLRLFPDDEAAEQRAAAEAAVRQWTTVITGGPGTGKTTTLARLLALLSDCSDRPLRIALAAPTGKAAARMTQAVADAVANPGFPTVDRPAVEGLSASTLHRLLGWRRDNGTRFRHDRSSRLPHDVIVVDETSMVSLTLMARLIEAVRPDARLVLVGDPDQLTSVEAGAVLKDLKQGFADRDDSPVRTLARNFRFGRAGDDDAIGELAAAIRDDRADDAWEVLIGGSERVTLVAPSDVEAIRACVEPTALALLEAGRAGDTAAALRHLDAHRLLCAHRDGPYGVGHWNRQIERWLLERSGTDWFASWYAGQPLIVGANDYGLRLWNGDTGVVVAREGGLQAVFADGGSGRALSLSRLSEVDTAHAMTVHRSQGSQFGEISVLLPEADSPTLTRELLYTAVTRAQHKVQVIATEECVRAAIARPARRATGLAGRLRPA
ncbi:exodeoxyribonuclease V subunit alpha [Alteromonas gracilis]